MKCFDWKWHCHWKNRPYFKKNYHSLKTLSYCLGERSWLYLDLLTTASYIFLSILHTFVTLFHSFLVCLNVKFFVNSHNSIVCKKALYILLEVLPYNDFQFHWTALGLVLSLLKFLKKFQCHLAEFALMEDSLYYNYNNNNWIYYLLHNTYISNVLCMNIQKRALWVIKYCYNYYYRKWLTHFSVYVIFNTSAVCERNYKIYLDLFWIRKEESWYQKIIFSFSKLKIFCIEICSPIIMRV